MIDAVVPGHVAVPAPGLSPAALPFLRELGDLKRIRSAQGCGSIAERLFALGLGADAVDILERAFDEVTGDVDPALAQRLRTALAGGRPAPGATPGFVDKLARQPRAGVTCPGQPRILLQPPENHAEHCLMVAVYGVLASPWHGADPVPVFLAGMAHHCHNADMADSGCSGEMLLGDRLDTAIDIARQACFAELAATAPALVPVVMAAPAPIGEDRTPEARAFHVGDVLDRVLEIEQHLRAARLSMDLVPGDYGLVHDGPVKAFHDRILADAGLL